MTNVGFSAETIRPDVLRESDHTTATDMQPPRPQAANSPISQIAVRPFQIVDSTCEGSGPEHPPVMVMHARNDLVRAVSARSVQSVFLRPPFAKQ
jgi:hypothetical protein